MSLTAEQIEHCRTHGFSRAELDAMCAMALASLTLREEAPTPCCMDWNNCQRACTPKGYRNGLEAGERAGLEAAAKVIPNTWLDPLLSGDRAVIRAPIDNSQIHSLLRILQENILALVPPAQPKGE